MEIYNDTYCVYVHINKFNGKKYVGQTINGNNINKRWVNGLGYRSCTVFYKAIKKYGWNNFEHDIVASNLTLEEANHFEELLIRELDTMNPLNGYNLKSGGENNKLSDETKRKIGNANKGRIISEEDIIKMSESRKGRVLPEEVRRKISESNKGKKLSDETKRKIGQSSLGRNIGRKHTEEEIKKMRKRGKTKKENPAYHKKKVIQLSKNGDVICQYESTMEAYRQTRINSGNISECCRGIRNTAGGYKWLFVDDI